MQEGHQTPRLGVGGAGSISVVAVAGSGSGVRRPIAMAELFGPPPPVGVKWQTYYSPDTEVFAFQPHILRNLLIDLRYNATLVWGRDITAGREIPPPNLPWANEWLLGLWDYIRVVRQLGPL